MLSSCDGGTSATEDRIRTHTVLIADADADIRVAIASCARAAGLNALEVSDGQAALQEAQAFTFDLLVLDMSLSQIEGISLCRAIRRESPNVNSPVLMLSARREESATVLALDSGADDVIAKPFGSRELTARIRALLRRAAPVPPVEETMQPVSYGGIRIDPERRKVDVAGRDVYLTRQEFDLLWQLLSRPGVVFSRQALLRSIWRESTFVQERTVDALVKRLRRKIEPRRGQPEILVTVHGVGYKSADPEVSAHGCHDQRNGAKILR